MEPIPFPLPRTLTVVCAPGAGLEPVSRLIARLAVRGPVTVLDGGNRFPGYRLLQLIRLHVPDPAAAAARLFVRRAFTCYQMLALLEGTPALPQPHVVLDPLATFFDEQVPLTEAGRLLEGCLRQLERLRRAGPVLVALAPPRTPERGSLVERVCARADTLYSLELPALPVIQPALF